jgi:two-component system chemotaxis sensor kinase CheA
MQLPLTLAITDALITRVGNQMFAVPQGTVREVLEVNTSVIKRIDQREVMPHRAGALPRCCASGHLFGIPSDQRDRLHVFVSGHDHNTWDSWWIGSSASAKSWWRPILDPLVRVDGVSGATDLGDGRVVLILDPAALARMAGRSAAAVVDRPTRRCACRKGWLCDDDGTAGRHVHRLRSGRHGVRPVEPRCAAHGNGRRA